MCLWLTGWMEVWEHTSPWSAAHSFPNVPENQGEPLPHPWASDEWLVQQKASLAAP